MKQSKTTLKELTAAYRAVLRHGILCNAIALGLMVATPAKAYDVMENVDLNSVFASGIIEEQLHSKAGYTGTLSVPDISVTGSVEGKGYLILVDGTNSVLNFGTADNLVNSINIAYEGNDARAVTVWDSNAVANLYARDITISAGGQGLVSWGTFGNDSGSINMVGDNVSITAANAVLAKDNTNLTIQGDTVNISGIYAGIETSGLGVANITAKDLTVSSTEGDAISAWTRIEGNKYTPGSGGKINIKTGDLTVNAAGTGLGANYMQSQITVDATGDVNIVAHGSDDTRAIHVGNSTTNPDIEKENTSFVSIKAKNINLKADNIGVSAMSNGFVDLDGNVSINARDAILARGLAHVNINKSGENTVKMNGNIDFDYDKATSGSKVDAIVDVTLAGADSYWTGNTTASYGSGQAPDESYMKVNSVSLTMKDGAVWNATKITDNKNDDTSGSGYVAMNNLDINKGTVNIADVQRGIVVENADVADATFNGGPLNIGTMIVSGDDNLFNTDVFGTDDNSKLVLNSDANMNIGSHTLNVHSILLNGDMFATLRDGDDAQIIADEFEGEGRLNLTMSKAGKYHVFGGEEFDNVLSTNAVYELNALADGYIEATVKSAEDIAGDTGVTNEVAQAISHVAQAESKQLQDLSIKLQEKLAEAESNPAAKEVVEHATKAIHPETESVAQSVSTSVQNTVVNLAGARMAMPAVGRSGGDVNLTSGGVWAQGLFNRSKQGSAFNGYTRGIAVGADGTLNNKVTVGAGYSFAHSDISGTARDTKIDSNTLFLYGQYKPSAWYLNAVANYTWSKYSEKGTVIDDVPVFADYSVKSYGGNVAAGYNFDTGITPELGLRYIHVSADDYTNSFGVKTHMDNTNFLTGILGAKYAFNVTAGKYATFMPQLNAGLKYDLLSDKNIATVTMPGVNSYTMDGGRLSRIGGEFGIGLGMKYRNLDLSVNYDIDVRDNYTSQTGMLKFRCNF